MSAKCCLQVCLLDQNWFPIETNPENNGSHSLLRLLWHVSEVNCLYSFSNGLTPPLSFTCSPLGGFNRLILHRPMALFLHCLYLLPPQQTTIIDLWVNEDFEMLPDVTKWIYWPDHEDFISPLVAIPLPSFSLSLPFISFLNPSITFAVGTQWRCICFD